jgi:hypothetical protein
MARSLHEWLADARHGSDDLGEIKAAMSRLVQLMMSEVRDWHRLFGNKGLYHLG